MYSMQEAWILPDSWVLASAIHIHLNAVSSCKFCIPLLCTAKDSKGWELRNL